MCVERQGWVLVEGEPADWAVAGAAHLMAPWPLRLMPLQGPERHLGGAHLLAVDQCRVLLARPVGSCGSSVVTALSALLEGGLLDWGSRTLPKVRQRLDVIGSWCQSPPLVRVTHTTPLQSLFVV